MHIIIAVYPKKALTKYGQLKKKAAHEYSRVLFDAEPYYPETVPTFLAETAAQLAKEYTFFSSPYMFTHIDATNRKTGEAVRIYETCNGLVTSPQTLLRNLQALPVSHTI